MGIGINHTFFFPTNLSRIYFVTFPENKKINITFVLSSTGEINYYLKHT